MPLRDIVLTIFFALTLLVAFRHPVVGVYVYTWVSMMNPHKMTFGFAFSLPFAQIAALVTLLIWATTRLRQPLPRTPIVYILLAMIAWMSVTSLFAMADTQKVVDQWTQVAKIQLMLLVTWMLVTDARKLRALIWVVTMSVVFFGVKGGIWTLLTGGGGRVWGPPGGMLENNNQLAVGLVMLMPILHFLRETEPRRWVRHLLLFSMVTTAFAILGSQSRGALLAIFAMAIVLGLKGKHPLRTSLGLMVLGGLALAFMPETWSTRMETIRTYEEDGSAMSRIWAWQTLLNAAMDRPLVGVGFGSDNLAVFAKYAPADGEYAVFAGRAYVAHSIYFQMLGEHGFVGVGLFLALGVVTWLTASRVARRAQGHPEFGGWMPSLMRMVQVSLVGYAVGGAFLSMAYVDLPYYIMGFVVLSSAFLDRSLRAVDRTDAATSPAAMRHSVMPPGGAEARVGS